MFYFKVNKVSSPSSVVYHHLEISFHHPLPPDVNQRSVPAITGEKIDLITKA
jgi:hypothetical protein